MKRTKEEWAELIGKRVCTGQKLQDRLDVADLILSAIAEARAKDGENLMCDCGDGSYCSDDCPCSCHKGPK